MGKAESHELAALLEQAGWVRNLAGRLLGDPVAAEDVTQETLVAALQERSSGDPARRSWLTGVVRNLVRARVRTEANRTQREAEACHRAPSPSAADVVARGESFRWVVQAVLELPEPYRSTILMRYFDGLSTAEIARKTGVSSGAIRTRHSRGLSHLREKLDRRHGPDARTWLAAMAPPLLPASIALPAFPLAASGGALLMSSKAILFSATLALVLGGLWLRSKGTPPAAVAGAEPVASAAESAQPALVQSTDQVPEQERVGMPVQTPAFEHPPISDPHAFMPQSAHIRGQVIDLSQQPVAGVGIRLLTPGNESQELATSDEDGSFEVLDAGTQGMLEAGNERYAPVFNAKFFGVPKAGSDPDPITLTLVVAVRAQFEGLVVDGDGGPIAAAEVTVDLPGDLRTRFDTVLENSLAPVIQVDSGADGHFSLEAGCVPGSRLIASKDGYPSSELELPPSSAFDLRLVLSSSGLALLSGQVIDAQARPIAGAQLAFGWQGTQSDEEGRFQFNLGDEPVGGWDPEEIVALHPNFLPVRIEQASQPGGQWSGPVTVQLSEEPQSIAGKVVRSSGDPVAGADLYVLNPMFFGPAKVGDGDRYGTADIEQLLNGSTQHSAALATTGADGSFVVEGLLPREYVLYVIEPATLTRATSTPVLAPASGVVIEMEQPELTPIAGRVVDKNRQAMPDIFVRMNIMRTVDRQGLPFGGGFPEFFYTRYSTRTDAEGRFAFPELDPTYVRLQVHRPGVVAVFHYDLATAEPPLDDLEITAYRRCHFLVDLVGQSDLADSFQLLDEQGESVPIVFSRGDMTMHRDEAELEEGRSETLSASEKARTLVLYKAGEIVQSLSIDLTPDETTRIGL